MWGSGYSSKASVWDCYAKYGEISLLLCLFSKEHPGKWKMQAHNKRFVKTRLEAGSSVSYCKFLADIQLLLLFCSQAHLSVWCHQIQWGREPEQIGTDSVLQPASLSAHVVTIQRVSRNQMCLKDSQTVRSPLKATKEKCLWKKCVCNNSTISVLANPSALQSSSFRKSEVRKRLRTHSQVCRPRCHNGHLSVMLKHFTLQTF